MLSEETVCIKLKKDLRERAQVSSAETFVVTAHPLVNKILSGPGGSQRQQLEEELGVKLVLKDKEKLSFEEYEIHTQ
jgi:ribonuclease G